jgi:predicted HAD superfamily Cof-like phosphohydrolase
MATKESNQVKEFRQAFNLPIGEVKPEIEIQHISIQTMLLHLKLINEESFELIEALVNRDIVEVADAIADIRYLLCGLELELNLQSYSEAIFDEVHASNMSKLDENGKPIYREDGKVLKSDKYFEPNIAKILNLE